MVDGNLAALHAYERSEDESARISELAESKVQDMLDDGDFAYEHQDSNLLGELIEAWRTSSNAESLKGKIDKIMSSYIEAEEERQYREIENDGE